MGGWHAIISHAVENHLKLSRVTCFLVNVEYAEDIPHQWSAEATRRPYVNWDLNQAVIFFTHFESTERGQRCEKKGAGSLATKASLEKWPHLNHPVSTHATTKAETELWACPARRVRGGGRGPISGHKKVQDVHGKDNVGRVGLGTRVHPSCHSPPRTLNCAKHCSNTVIWTKNNGLSFLLPFF